MDDLSGQVIKGYELHQRVGMGGFGAVYRAYQPVVGRDVAIKVIRPEFANHPDFIRRFEAEAQLIARLESPYIVPLYDYWRDPSGAYLVMRWLPMSLRISLANGPWTAEATARLLEQVAAALTLAHRHGVVHRDIKPDNVLLDSDDNAYLADFGIAKILAGSEGLQEDVVTGSPAYFAPEQILSEPVTPQSDLYSLGILIYEALSGEKPYGDKIDTTELIRKHLNDPLPPIYVRRPDLSEAVDEVLQQATAKDPARRFTDAMTMAAAFRMALRPGYGDSVTMAGGAVSPSLPSSTLRMATAVGVALELENPYKGLRAFQEADAADFFGRESLVEQLLARLSQPDQVSRFLAVIGPSGSGKSSVVRAGLIPALRKGALPGSDRWFIIEMIPGPRPLEELEAALLRIAVNPPDSLLGQLREDERGLARAIKRVLPGDEGSELVLFIDQFEEIFTLSEDEAARAHLLNSLLAAATDPRSQLRLIVTLRADFYDKPLLYPDFGGLIRQRTEVVLPLSVEELEHAIVKPAQRIGMILETELIGAIVQDVGEQPGALPLLQYALTELFERRQGLALTLEGYRASGGVLGALARRADRLYEGLDPANQEAARQIFLRLVQIADGAEDTRRRVRHSELASVLSDEKALASVLEAFSAYRLLTLDRDESTREQTVEVAHEALIRTWGRLKNWLNASREYLRVQRRLMASAAEWANAKRDPSFLASGARLAEFETLATESDIALNQDEREYLNASIAEREKQRQAEEARKTREIALERRSRDFLRALAAVLLVATLGAIGLAGLALTQRQAAQESAATATNAQGQAVVEALRAENNAGQAQRLALASAAQVALSKGNTDLALALAAAANRTENPPALAQQILYEAAYAPGTRRVLTGHTDAVRSVTFSPDGKMALSASQDKSLILWDVNTGQIIRRFTGHDGNVWTVAFSPDGKTALSGSDDKSLILWDINTGQIIRRFTGHKSDVRSVVFNPDGKTALSGSYDFSLILWDIATGKPIRQFMGHTGNVWSVAFSPDGRTALSGSSDRTMILWDVASGRQIRQFAGHSDAVRAVAFSPDGHSALSGSFDTTLILWDIESGQPIFNMQGHSGSVLSVAFNSDNRTAISSSTDNTLILWSLASGQALYRYRGHTNTVSSVALSPDGKTALSSSHDKTLRLWYLESHAEAMRFTGYDDYVVSAVFSPDGKQVLSRAISGSLLLSDAVTGKPIRRFIGYTRPGFGNVAFSPDGKMALSGTFDAVMLWDVEKGLPIRRFAPYTEYVDPASANTFFSAVAFSPDGQTALFNAPDHSLTLVHVASGQTIHRFSGYSDAINTAVFSPDGRYILAGFGTYAGASSSAMKDSSLRLWDSSTGRELRRYVGHTDAVMSVAFSPNSQYIVSGSVDGSVRLWDTVTGKELRSLFDHNSGVFSVNFSRDGKYVLSGAANGSVILWNIQTGEQWRHVDVAAVDFVNVAFSPDGQNALISGDLRLWRLTTSLDDLIAWTYANRYVPELTCDQRELYHFDPSCSVSGVFPTRTPFQAVAQAVTPTNPANGTLTVTEITETPGPSATAVALTPSAVPVKAQTVKLGVYPGKVPAGGGEVWIYTGKAGERLTIHVDAALPANKVSSPADQKAQGLLNTRLIVHAPDSSVIGFSDDVEFGANTDSLLENLPLPVNGDYQIEVRSSPEGATSGAYTLVLQAGKIVTPTATPTTQKPEPPTQTPTLTPIGASGARPTPTP